MGIKRRYYMNYYNKRTTFARLTINGACDEEEYEFWAQQAKLIEQECPEVLKK